MALKGIKVLELAGLAPAPFCGEKIFNSGALQQISMVFTCGMWISLSSRNGFIGLWCDDNKSGSND